MVFELNPVTDARWSALAESHPRASVFHTPGWLRALSQTYGFQPSAVTSATPGEALRDGLVFCRVGGWLGGRRIVSLPFSDHCEPLVEGDQGLALLLKPLIGDGDAGRRNRIEIRPVTPPAGPPFLLEPGSSYWLHRLDLRPGLESVFRGFHKDCVQRRIRKAEKEGLEYRTGRSEDLLASFYRLVVLTRRRQKLPPQPIAWFRNLIGEMGERLSINVAEKRGEAVAAILTLRHKDTLTYKYGCSEKRLASLGGMQFLFWSAIQDAMGGGLTQFDLGRTDMDNEGLTAFKDRLGATRATLQYWQYPAPCARPLVSGWGARVVREALAAAPDPVLKAASSLLYRHFA